MDVGGCGCEESLLAVIADLRSQNAALVEQIGALTAQIAVLTARLGADSSNSSRPPSQDGPGARQRSLRKPTGRKPGGQPGREGKTLAMVADPDEIVEHRPIACDGCGGQFDAGAVLVATEARQVFDLPPMRLVVTEHRLHSQECGACHTITRAAAPPEAVRQVQYGPGVCGLAAYLAGGQYIAMDRVSEFFETLFGQPISPATVTKMVAAAAATIAERFKPVAAHLLATSAYAHADETGFKVAGKTQWVHSISSPNATWIQAHPNRGRAAINDIGVLDKYSGVLVHDAWATYDTLENVSDHQLCCAHALRELQAVADNHTHAPGQWCWAEQAQSGLRQLIHNPADANGRHLLISALEIAERNDPDPTGKLGAKFAALRRRLRGRINDYLRFTTMPGLPPTNNPAEQEIRMVKVKQKVSGCMRTLTGANDFLALRSYLSTARKHGLRALDVLTTLFSPNPWLPVQP